MLETPRLILRRWRDADRAPFAALNADPEVMRYFPATLDRQQSDAFVDRIEQHFDEHGYGLWALEHRGSGEFLGFVGLKLALFEAHFTPAPEVGWRLARAAWGQGYASEAATAALAAGFERFGLDEIVSMTALLNERSQRVMQRIGMHRDPADDFDHPLVAPSHPLRRHLLYRLGAQEWRGSRS
ncbi:GNAT family N-acetyltransferase [Herbiconiux sp. SYSU D00978]|uniref:GNAT family N-acetyltransferase n=1 Tax=Herbiconiux sp. SYSU D00978 TaxID=2812562 RepID=UPI001A95B014|nr:GNAT family N-acetyltransferase [Herbiconiux sp. SYSU D00978]